MLISFRIKRLLVIALLIIIVAIAANSGLKEDHSRAQQQMEAALAKQKDSANFDPNAIDPSLVQPAPMAIPKPIVVKAAAPPRPLISAEAYIVANLDTGILYSAHNPSRVFPIASLSKLITALVALHSMSADQQITITQEMLDAGYGEAGHLGVGESYKVSELFYPLLLESSNDAAEVLARAYGYPDFIQAMNAFVGRLGMTSTFFRDPSGISSGNVSNAADLLILAKYLYLNEKPLLDLTRKTTMTLASTTEHSLHTFNTINPFPFDPHFIGGKTGRTIEAKESMVSLFRYDQGGVSYPIAVIVLRSDFSDREIDTSTLFEQFISKIPR